jgi:hypothetical protein
MDKKSTQLGMPFGTAQNRLKRKLLFFYIRANGKNYCFRCNQPMDEATYSIDHIEDWQDNDPALFWDTFNIAFSHKTCNYKSGRKIGGYGKRKDSGPEGTSWCPLCDTYKAVSEFYLDTSRWNGYRRLCKNCFDRSRGRIV